MREKRFEITGNALKLIACITMLIDHIAAGLLKFWWQNSFSIAGDAAGDRLWNIYIAMRAIGRMAFPIYCFMLVEGFFHTRNLKKYVLRLLGIAIISEVPFDYLFHRRIFTFAYNNVLWELLVAIIMMYAFKRIADSELGAYTQALLRAAAFVAAAGLAYVLHFDYSYAGICAVAIMYFLYGHDRLHVLISYALGVLMLVLMSNELEIAAFAMLVPFAFYRGHKGADSVALKWFFYLFYPMHLTLLSLVALI